MRLPGVDVGVAAAVAEGVELLDVADAQAGLRLDPCAQTHLKGAMLARIELPPRQAGARFSIISEAGDQNRRLTRLRGDDGGSEADLDRGAGFAHSFTRDRAGMVRLRL